MSLSNQPGTFDDPALKAAISRVWGAERAPADLYRRVTDALDRAREAADSADLAERPAASADRAYWQRHPRQRLFGLAAAASVLVALGGVFIAVNRTPTKTTSPTAGLPNTALPATLAQQLVRTHDGCCKEEDHHFLSDAPRDDFGQIAAALRRKLGHPVVAASVESAPSSKDWRFRGASVCQVGSTPSGHLVFAHDPRDAQDKPQFVSLFSLPASSLPSAPDNADVQTTVAGHPIVGFVKDGGFYCLVGSSPDGGAPPTEQQLAAMRDRLRTHVTQTAAAPAHRTTVAAAN